MRVHPHARLFGDVVKEVTSSTERAIDRSG